MVGCPCAYMYVYIIMLKCADIYVITHMQHAYRYVYTYICFYMHIFIITY